MGVLMGQNVANSLLINKLVLKLLERNVMTKDEVVAMIQGLIFSCEQMRTGPPAALSYLDAARVQLLALLHAVEKSGGEDLMN